MVERRPWLDFFSHLILIAGVLVIAFPLYMTFVASTQTTAEVARAPMSLVMGDHFWENYKSALIGVPGEHTPPVGRMLWEGTVMALVIAIGKIAISMISAFAVVYFRFPFRILCFRLIFVPLMLAVEYRIIPTYEVVANLCILNSYVAVSLPLIASATAAGASRDFFLSAPAELVEAARI